MNMDSLVTIDQVAKEFGCNQSTVWRAVNRAGRDECTVKAFGRVLIKKNKVKKIQTFYFPRGSKRAAEMAKRSGSVGGNTRAANAAENA